MEGKGRRDWTQKEPEPACSGIRGCHRERATWLAEASERAGPGLASTALRGLLLVEQVRPASPAASPPPHPLSHFLQG